MPICRNRVIIGFKLETMEQVFIFMLQWTVTAIRLLPFGIYYISRQEDHTYLLQQTYVGSLTVTQAQTTLQLY